MPKQLHKFKALIGFADVAQGYRLDISYEIGCVVPDSRRCVQCGVCSYNCPVGIPVRDYVRQGLPITNPDCITCGQCIQVCPRGTLRWETKNPS